MPLYYLSLGSNQGDREAQLAQARQELAALGDGRLEACSPLYETAPVGYTDQGDFLNQVVALSTPLEPLAVLEAAKAIEGRAGRVRTVRWGPRPVDVDIIWYDGSPVREERLQVPHPRLEERCFVLRPLADLAPDLVLSSGRTVREALGHTRDQVVTPYPSRRG